MTSISIETALEILRAELGANTVVGSPERGALAVARPAGTAEVQRCLGWATEHGVPVVTIGNGSRLDADIVTDGALVVCTERLASTVGNDDGTITARAGARTEDVLAAAAAAGGWLPLTPGPATTIGGDVATAATTGLPFLDLRAYLVQLQVVLADGQVMCAAGTDAGGPMALVNLFAGSRGLLGLVTEVTLRPTPPPDLAAALLGFADPAVAGDAALEVCAAVPGASVQLFSHLSLAGPTSFVPSDGTVLLVSCDPDERSAVEEIGMAFGAEQITVCPPGPDALTLLGHGGAALPMLRTIGATLREPLAVPPTRLAEFCACVGGIERSTGSTVVLVAQADAGAVQPFVISGPADGGGSAGEALAQLLDLACELVHEATGTGDGLVATGWTARALDGRRCDTERRMKKALDPHGLLNPGLVY